MTDKASSALAGLEGVEIAPSVVTIGNFDGLHLGHQRLITRTLEAARARGIRSVAVTFDPHPMRVLRPDVSVGRLTDLATRQRLLVEAGIDLVVVLSFTPALSRLSPQEFIDHVVIDRLQSQRVVVGANFRFGHRAAGDVTVLREAGRAPDADFDVDAVDLLTRHGAIVSTSAVRAALERGDVETATAFLGRDHLVVGNVIQGDGRGRTIGVPTANVDVAPEIVVPAHGVYAGRMAVDGEWLPCVTNVGVRPTVAHEQLALPTVESHLIDRDIDLYGREVTVTFAHRLRAEQRFDGLDQLVDQIRRDIAAAKTLVGGVTGS
ncbi:MAG: bifunctional riboflavin kinase/FAD synthetase [Nitriliruptoraceae bacterium]